MLIYKRAVRRGMSWTCVIVKLAQCSFSEEADTTRRWAFRGNRMEMGVDQGQLWGEALCTWDQIVAWLVKPIGHLIAGSVHAASQLIRTTSKGSTISGFIARQIPMIRPQWPANCRRCIICKIREPLRDSQSNTFMFLHRCLTFCQIWLDLPVAH